MANSVAPFPEPVQTVGELKSFRKTRLRAGSTNDYASRKASDLAKARGLSTDIQSLNKLRPEASALIKNDPMVAAEAAEWLQSRNATKKISPAEASKLMHKDMSTVFESFSQSGGHVFAVTFFKGDVKVLSNGSRAKTLLTTIKRFFGFDLKYICSLLFDGLQMKDIFKEFKSRKDS